MISLRSTKNHPLLKIWISDENTASPVWYITYSSHWLVCSTKIFQTPLSMFAGPDIWRCLRYFDMWGIHEEISAWNTACPVWYMTYSSYCKYWPVFSSSPDKLKLCKHLFGVVGSRHLAFFWIFRLARYPRGHLFKENTFLSQKIYQDNLGYVSPSFGSQSHPTFLLLFKRADK